MYREKASGGAARGSGAGFRSLTEAIDTTTPAGRMMMQMVGAFTESKGRCSRNEPRWDWMLLPRRGTDRRTPSELTPRQQIEIRKMVSKGHKTADDAARLFKIHPATISRLLAGRPSRQRGRPNMPITLTKYTT